jgi:hypothetical protein
MGMIYRRKKRDPATGLLVEAGPHWMKYYSEGRPIQKAHGRLIGLRPRGS